MRHIQTRHIPGRALAVLRRHVTAVDYLQAGRDFLVRFRGMPALRIEGAAGAPFCTYCGADGSGPAVWCWPLPGEQAARIACLFADVSIRAELAHDEAFVHLEQAGLDGGKAVAVLAAISTWAAEHDRQPGGAPRVALIRNPDSLVGRPDCDLVIPLR